MIDYKCPFRRIFGIPCPGCGITRAHRAALKGDFREAFRQHPLFFLVGPVIMYLAHRRRLEKPLKLSTETAILALVMVAFLVVYLIRALNGTLKEGE